MSRRILVPVAMLMLAAPVAAGTLAAQPDGLVGPDRGVLPTDQVEAEAEPAAAVDSVLPAPPAFPTSAAPIAFFWIPLELPLKPGFSKASIGGIVAPDAQAAAPTPLEEEKLALARAAVEAARAVQAGANRPDGTPVWAKVPTALAPPLQPDPAACLMVPAQPHRETGPTGLSPSEKAKCDQLRPEGGRP